MTTAKLTHLPFSLLNTLCRVGTVAIENKRKLAAIVDLQTRGAAVQKSDGSWHVTPRAAAILAADIALPGKRK